MVVKKIDRVADHSSLKELFAAATYNKIDNVNWSAYPAKPAVEFAILHDGDNIYLNYQVKEEYTLAAVGEDHGEVWTDSCVEFFIKLGEEGYYNFEFTSIGRGLLAYRVLGEEAQRASAEVMGSIVRIPTIGNEPFAEVKDSEWGLTLIIPRTALFAHNVETLSGVECGVNFYKCGDNLTVPHFLSWNKIDYPKPNFHLPQFFGSLKFE